MENKEELIERYKEEMSFLDQLYGKIDLSISKDETMCETHLTSFLAWYIEILKKEKHDSWKEEIQSLIDSVLNVEDGLERFRFLDISMCNILIAWYTAHNYDIYAKLIKYDIEGFRTTYKFDENNKIARWLPGVILQDVPQWYYAWLSTNNLGKSILSESRHSLARTIRDIRNNKEE